MIGRMLRWGVELGRPPSPLPKSKGVGVDGGRARSPSCGAPTGSRCPIHDDDDDGAARSFGFAAARNSSTWQLQGALEKNTIFVRLEFPPNQTDSSTYIGRIRVFLYILSHYVLDLDGGDSRLCKGWI